jgi:hypothetical protein
MQKEGIMKAFQAIAGHQQESSGELRTSAPLSPKESAAIDAQELGYHFSVRLWLATHSVAPSREEALSRSIASSLHELAPIRGRWAFLTREEKSCASWANRGPRVSLTKDRSESGH